MAVEQLRGIFRHNVKEPFVANHTLFIRVCTDQRIVLAQRNNAFPLTHPFERLYSPPHPSTSPTRGDGSQKTGVVNQVYTADGRHP